MFTRNKILILNLGSTSVKGSVFELNLNQTKKICAFSYKLSEVSSIQAFIASQLPEPSQFLAIAFRVVHGGKNFKNARFINQEIIDGIIEAQKLAPLHNSMLLKWYNELKIFLPKDIKLIACFDTSFFYDLPPISKTYPISTDVLSKYQIEKLGFHGFAHQSMLRQLNKISCSKVITLQLGGGCSITASLNGKPLETSMGFTPLDGLMMATRSGSIDPGIIFYLIKKGLAPLEIENMLNHESGLKGFLGTDDMQKIVAMNTDTSKFVLQLFCRNIAKFLGSYITLLGGVDVIVFGGGIGENCVWVRKEVISYLHYLGIYIDESQKNPKGESFYQISAYNSKAAIYIIKPDEELEMVNEVKSLLMEN